MVFSVFSMSWASLSFAGLTSGRDGLAFVTSNLKNSSHLELHIFLVF